MTKEELIRQLASQLTKEASEEGRIVELGWRSYEIMVLPVGAPEIQKRECRLAFFAGAQHLFASLMVIIDSDREPTAEDLNRMMLINKELNRFVAKLNPTTGD